MATTLKINGKRVTTEASSETPLLWFLRDELGLVGTKFGCGIAQCGACTVHVDGLAMRGCQTTLKMAEGSDVKTIEGLADGDKLHALQQAWIDLDVAQCGYCQAGQIMAAAALLNDVPRPSDEDIDMAMSSNLCRCGTYPRSKAAIKRAAGMEG